MTRSHLVALRKKRAKIDEKIHQENVHAARNEQAIKVLKRERLHVEEEIGRFQEAR